MNGSLFWSKSGGIWMMAVCLLLFSYMGSAAADMYKWVDEKGVIHFSDQPPSQKQPPSQIETIPTVTSRAVPATAPVQSQSLPMDVKPGPKGAKAPAPKKPKASGIVLYVTSWCKYCKKAKEFLRSRNIAFTEYDIEKDPQAARRRRELDSRSGVPLAIINGQILLGFSEASYSQALNTR